MIREGFEPPTRVVQHISRTRYGCHMKELTKIHISTKLHPRILILTPLFNQSEFSARTDKTDGRTDGPTEGRTYGRTDLRTDGHNLL